jgi:hypothetical protein
LLGVVRLSHSCADCGDSWLAKRCFQGLDPFGIEPSLETFYRNIRIYLTAAMNEFRTNT